MEELQQQLLYTRQTDDSPIQVLKQLERQLSEYSSNKFQQEQRDASSPDVLQNLITQLILEHIVAATNGLPGCGANGAPEKLGKSMSSFEAATKPPKNLSKVEAAIRTKFLQTAESMTRSHELCLEETAVLSLRSTIFNNIAMIHRLCGRPHAALRCLVAAAEVEVDANLSDADQALTHLNLSAVLSTLDRHRDSLGHANIAIKLLTRRVKANESDATKAASLLAMAHYNAAVEREHMKHTSSSLMSYRTALKMAKEQLPKEHPVIAHIASGMFDASTNSVESYKLPTPPSGSPRSPRRGRGGRAGSSPRSDRIVLKHLGLTDDEDALSKTNAPFGSSSRGGSGSGGGSPRTKIKRIKRYGSLEEEVLAQFKDALKNGNRMIHGTKIETIEDIFIAIDTDGGGTISTAEFKIGLRRLSIILSNDAVNRLMKDLDPDNKGEFTFDKFMGFMSSKFKRRAKTVRSTHIASSKVLSKSAQQKLMQKKRREALHRASPTAAAMMASDDATTAAGGGVVAGANGADEDKVSTTPTAPTADSVSVDPKDAALHTLFMEFDTNSSGHITLDELHAMLKVLPERSGISDMEEFSEDDANQLMNAFDEDGNGEIEESEFSGWIKNGLKKTKEERETFAAQSTLAKKLCQFLNAVEVLMEALL